MDARVLLRVFLRTYLVGSAFNTKGMQNVGLSYIMEPGLQALHGGDPSALRKARNRYLKHYNSHPFWTPLVVGIFLSMEAKIAAGLLPPELLSKLRATTVYALSALGDSFFGGSFLVMWSLIGVNLAVRGHVFFLAVWMFLCLVGLHAFKAYTFGRGYAQGLAFLQRLKSWNLIDWGTRIKCCNGLLLAFFAEAILPGAGPWRLAWAGAACLAAAVSMFRTRDRCVLLAVLVFLGLMSPWDRLWDWFRM